MEAWKTPNLVFYTLNDGFTDEEMLIKFLIPKSSESNNSCLGLLFLMLSLYELCICIKCIHICNTCMQDMYYI